MRWRIRAHYLQIRTSNKYTYAQVFSQEENRVVFSASSIEKSVRDALKEQGKSTGTREASAFLGQLVAERARERGIAGVEVRLRPGQSYYHERVGSLIDSIRNNGLSLL